VSAVACMRLFGRDVLRGDAERATPATATASAARGTKPCPSRYPQLVSSVSIWPANLSDSSYARERPNAGITRRATP
jgi:hypothetical protein